MTPRRRGLSSALVKFKVSVRFDGFGSSSLRRFTVRSIPTPLCSYDGAFNQDRYFGTR